MLSKQEPPRLERNYYIVGKKNPTDRFKRVGEQGGDVTFVVHAMYTYFYTERKTAQQVCDALIKQNPEFIFEVRKHREA